MERLTETQKRYLIAGVCIALLALFLIFRAISVTEDTEPVVYVESEPQIAEQTPVPVAEIVVHVAGAVEQPGVYTLQEGQRVEDALQMAGISTDAEIDALNRAAILSDGQKIIVPSKNELMQQEQSKQEQGQEAVEKINLNQADLQQLMTLPGIGEVKAQAILSYRQQQGRFESIEQIQQVSGIGSAIYAQIASQICV